MNVDKLLRELVAIGKSGEFSKIPLVAELQDHSSVLRLADVHHDQLIAFAMSQPLADQIALVKSIAVVENQIGGLGSVTNLERLLALVLDPERKLLDWILRNTKSYSYYSFDACSIEEYDAACRRKAERATEGIRRDEARQAQDRKLISETATKNLFNAVRRGDLKAVRALVQKVADVNLLTPDGSSLVSLATSKGYDAIATELRNAGAK
jgi:dTDP-4-dehydrorhamnose reductase